MENLEYYVFCPEIGGKENVGIFTGGSSVGAVMFLPDGKPLRSKAYLAMHGTRAPSSMQFSVSDGQAATRCMMLVESGLVVPRVEILVVLRDGARAKSDISAFELKNVVFSDFTTEISPRSVDRYVTRFSYQSIKIKMNIGQTHG
ncbi:MAG: hypothetical protein DWQ47_02410 [Acidobacteria bacterium]|nr:MAG: hypothetical protein DWQ32_05960 [Acidobacteriota bacterium]REK01268.1 MAG: hypothetical protein DWQ38_02395 [Acidobacteriota bacterium]REK14224.1 MAG: hypothetical protein DWQ43_11650 [Acidobacteriota bacterium]REK44939.1 MAG: hypothetical protein DWQ47_02410 [Acidobacteriota bacterium]